MEVFQDDHVEERRIRARVGWDEVQEAVRTIVGKKLGLSLKEAKSLTVAIQQETEGSPAYSVARWTAKVEGAIDLRPQPADASELMANVKTKP